MPALVRGLAEEEMKCAHPRSAPCGWALYFALLVGGGRRSPRKMEDEGLLVTGVHLYCFAR